MWLNKSKAFLLSTSFILLFSSSVLLSAQSVPSQLSHTEVTNLLVTCVQQLKINHLQLISCQQKIITLQAQEMDLLTQIQNLNLQTDNYEQLLKTYKLQVDQLSSELENYKKIYQSLMLENKALSIQLQNLSVKINALELSGKIKNDVIIGLAVVVVGETLYLIVKK